MLIPFLVPFVIAMFLAINMGGSGTAPAFSAAYGANMIKKTVIPGLFGLAVFAGAIIGGKQTATTVGKGLLRPELMTFSIVSIILFSVALSLFVANLIGVPQSTSQSTVLAVVAPALYYNSLNSYKLFYEILPTWFVMPVLSFVIALLVGKYIYRPMRRQGLTISKQVNESPIIKCLVVGMAMYVAFSIGTNNVANAVGPIASLSFNILEISEQYYVHVLILGTLIVAPCFAIGSSLFGYKIVKNTGKEIVLFGKIEAIIIALISATLLLASSVVKGIPTSLVQLNVAAILGIGVAKLGWRNIFRKTEVNKFFVMWLVAPIIAFVCSLLLTCLVDLWGIDTL